MKVFAFCLAVRGATRLPIHQALTFGSLQQSFGPFCIVNAKGFSVRDFAANAKARATQAVKAGRMSQSTEAKIDAKANKKLGKGRSRGC